jgi:nucleoside-diphosphate-sugar epimerase
MEEEHKMNILLLGHEGYLGRGLAAYLERNHHIVGWDKKEDLFNLSAATLARENIEVLINLSLMHDRQAKTYQVDSLPDKVNVMGARHLAHILKGSQITWFQFSTREVFPPIYTLEDVIKTDQGYRPKFLIDENRGYAPQSMHGKTKVISEFVSESHPFSNVIRLTSPYTDYDHASGGWVLQLAKTIVAGRPIKLTRGGEQFRDPLHTDDLARLMEQLHGKKVFGEKIHAGGGEENLISLREFVLLADPKAQVESVEGGDYGFAFDNSKALKLTGWKPTVRIREKIPVIMENVRRASASQ